MHPDLLMQNEPKFQNVGGGEFEGYALRKPPRRDPRPTLVRNKDPVHVHNASPGQTLQVTWALACERRPGPEQPIGPLLIEADLREAGIHGRAPG